MENEDIETIENAEEFIQSTISAGSVTSHNGDTLRCIGTLCCSHCEFNVEDPGCAAHLSYCPQCNDAIRKELHGKEYLISSTCAFNNTFIVPGGVVRDASKKHLPPISEADADSNKQSPGLVHSNVWLQIF